MKTMMTQVCVWASVTIGLAASAGQAHAQSFQLRTERIVNGLSNPLFVTAPTGDTSRIFIVEQRSGSTGRIRILNLPGNTLNATPYLSVSPVSTGSEQGLLGLAFHPNFASNGYFWVNYTNSAGNTVVARYRAAGGNPAAATADSASATTVLTVTQDFSNHNGGWMAFGPDGFLYISMGDGGSGNDPNQRAQSITTNLGKMLRIDVDGADNIPGNADDDAFPADATRLYSIPADNPYVGVAGNDEIYMLGLRNAWRSAFDRQTGDLWIADVGQDAREEVNFVPAGQGNGWNFGWRCLEGTRPTGLSGCNPSSPTLRAPILEYGHTTGTAIGPTTILGCSITGGIVYRGASLPCFQGNYIFADYCTGDIWSFQRGSGGTPVNVVNRTAQLDPPGTLAIQNITSFGEDANGELYIVDQTGGEVYRVFAGPVGTPDCNTNGIADNCEIAAGLVQDGNNNGIPDVCELPTCDSIDFNNDTSSFDPQDVEAFLSVYGEGPCVPGTATCNDIDFNNDNSVFDPCDIASFLTLYGEGPCTSCGA